MNKIVLLGMAVCMVPAFNSCKPKQSTYKAAYEQAQQRSDSTSDEFDEFGDFSDDDIDLAPVSKPRSEGSLDTENAFDIDESLNYATRQERVNPYPYEDSYGSNDNTGFGTLQRYNVVIGSFRNRTNANALRERMQYEGYNAILAQNEVGMIRVIVFTTNSKADAVRNRNTFKSKHYPNFQDLWILEQRY
ncbi:hypothetical protein AGMMS49574_23130 [Bacteroidia bacterium]|nr:hypothetical protein AGMMS49574_23130 [Bacteroidia bacterium]GHU57132.1 hypothetical protein FACS189411_09790 [Bacteroidia bacterium]